MMKNSCVVRNKKKSAGLIDVRGSIKAAPFLYKNIYKDYDKIHKNLSKNNNNHIDRKVII